MIRLQAPVPDPSADLEQQVQAQLDAAVDASNNDMLRAELENLRGAWSAYVKAGGNPERLDKGKFPRSPRGTQGPQTPGDILFEIYGRAGVAAVALQHIRERSCDHCPYCGMRLVTKAGGRQHDRDHALPRSEFPEFSVLSLNLVVACDGCNDGKLARYVDEDGRWLFIHPYFDDFLARGVIRASVVEGDTPRFAFEIAPDIDGDDRARVERHAATLDLWKRLQEYVSDPIVTILESLAAMDGDPDRERCAKALLAAASGSLQMRPNDPLGVCLSALARSDVLGPLLQECRTRVSTRARRGQSGAEAPTDEPFQ